MVHATALPDPILQEDFYADTPLKRLFAWIIDTILIVLICVAILLFTAFIGILFFGFLLLVVSFVYRVLTIAGGSATLGMRLMSIQFRNQWGEKFGLGEAALHTLGYSISMSIPLIQVVSVVLMLTTSRKQGLTDMVMGSVVINKPSRY